MHPFSFSVNPLIAILTCLCLSLTANAEPPLVAYKVVSNISYLGEERPEKMDAYLPVVESGKKTPAVLFIHGGGWAAGSKSSPRSKSIAKTLAEQGFAVYCIDYQLTIFEGKLWTSKKTSLGWPQNIYDCKSAIRYIRKHADRDHVKPDDISVMGCSAGGHLALLTALSANCYELNQGGLYRDVSCEVKSVVDLYGIPDVRIWGGGAFISGNAKTNRSQWDLASPVTHLSPKSPPILILHGDQDQTVKIDLSRQFAVELTKQGLLHQFVEVEGGVHSFNLQPPQQDLRPTVIQFLRNPGENTSKEAATNSLSPHRGHQLEKN